MHELEELRRRSRERGVETHYHDIDGVLREASEEALRAMLAALSSEGDEIRQSEVMGMAMLRLRKFMFENVYLDGPARTEHEKVHRTMRILFEHYLARPDEVPVFDPEATSSSASPTCSPA